MSCKNSVCDIESQDHFHVVLVEPENSLNIGAVARAMTNLGFHKLHLISPPNFNEEKAKATACWASDIIDNAEFHDSLEDALAPMEEVVGFTARHGKYRPAHLFLPDWIEEIKDAPRKRTALLFGSEKNGLGMESIEHCRFLIRIPSTEENPAFNLAQSVLLALYELSRMKWQGFEAPKAFDQADWNSFYQLDQKMERVLKDVGFYREGSPETIPALIMNLVRRMQPDEREMKVLLGMFNKIETTLQLRSEGKVDLAVGNK